MIELGWEILYHNVLYWELGEYPEFDPLRISDIRYDRLVQRYLKLAKQLGVDATAYKENLNFDRQKPSHMSALAKVLIDHHFKVRKEGKI